jgi:hypothetical protein
MTLGRRSWSHPQEPTTEEWWADVLADPRARKRERRTDLAVKQAFYRLGDEKRDIILVACSKCDWRAAFARRPDRHAWCRLSDAHTLRLIFRISVGRLCRCVLWLPAT